MSSVLLVQFILGAYGGYFGGFCGANIGRSAPAGVVRVGTLMVSVGITLAFFARAYLK